MSSHGVALSFLLGLAPALAIGALACKGAKPVKKPEPAVLAAQTEVWMKIVHSDGRQGYWLVVRGYHVPDALISAITDSPVSHAVVYDRTTDEVIEATGKGVHITGLKDLLDHSHRMILFEPNGWSEAEGVAAVVRARSVLGHKYDFLGLIGLGSDTRFYCSELAVWAYDPKGKGWDVPKVIKPKNMYKYGRVVYDSGPRDSEPAELPDD